MSQKAECVGEKLDYQSYLLRLWQVCNSEEGWRASLENANTGERKGFATLDALFDYVRSQIRVGSSVHSWEEGEKRGRG